MCSLVKSRRRSFRVAWHSPPLQTTSSLPVSIARPDKADEAKRQVAWYSGSAGRYPRQSVSFFASQRIAMVDSGREVLDEAIEQSDFSIRARPATSFLSYGSVWPAASVFPAQSE